MRKSLKLALGLCLMAWSLIGALSPSSASAFFGCPNLCCDPSCIGVYECHSVAGQCVCTPYCVLLPRS
jgi:hypothetical protein